MDVLNNRGAKAFFLRLLLILTLGLLLAQFLVYLHATSVKQILMQHDYELAGRLSTAYPHLSSVEVAALFTADKREVDAGAGREILKEAGYTSGMKMRFLPAITSLYQTDVVLSCAVYILLGSTLLLIAYRFLRRLYQTIDLYQEEVDNVMYGGRTTRIDDTEEGSLSKLAAAMNTMISSLQTHIDKEKQNRLFLKEMMMNISHQLKTPLSALFIYNEIMQGESVPNETVTNFLLKSGHELERIESLITNLLKMARLDAGIIELQKKPHLLTELIYQAVASFETRLEREQKHLEIEADAAVTYLCDKEWLLEAVSNLLKNALEHTESGETISVRLEETPLLVNIEVADSGEGVHPEDFNHLFKPFYRSRVSLNKQGTGIGLSLARTIAEMHGGFISLDSKLGQGAKFTIHLPRLTKL